MIILIVPNIIVNNALEDITKHIAGIRKMKKCSKEHEEISFEGKRCPICPQILELKSKIDRYELELNNYDFENE